MRTNNSSINISIFIGCIFTLLSCKKLVEIAPPIDTITTEQVFENNKQAEWAMAGVYSRMINGSNVYQTAQFEQFAAGLANLAGGLSSDELIVTAGNSDFANYALNINALTVLNASNTNQLWKSAYKTIYDANGVIEGIAASTSPALSDSVRKQLTAEAKTIRAFAYFYLVNFFGDLPLVETIDYNKTKNLARRPKSEIYDLIARDLTEAKANLPGNFFADNDERIRINKWFAAALLARVYLYTGQYQNAVNNATEVISQSSLFELETDLNKVFLKNNKEAIWQLAQLTQSGEVGTPEGKMFIPESALHFPPFYLSDSVMNLFDAADKRRINWIESFQQTPTSPVFNYPFKYKVGLAYGTQTEYCTIMRLAELYLVRAEANILLSAGNKNIAITDLNVLRQRAGIADLSSSLTASEVINAIANERRRELFAEWGHRWLDLKRTGKAVAVLSAIPYKQPWKGDYQLLYPVPKGEIEVNYSLTQNPQYNNF